MREILDHLNPEILRPLFKKFLSLVINSKALVPYRFYKGHHLIAVDGTGFFSSDSIHCEQCLVSRNKKTNKKHYRHQMLCGAIVHPEQKVVIPLYPEPIRKQDGTDKNDCEQNVLKRFIRNFRKDHPRCNAGILGIDDAWRLSSVLMETGKEVNERVQKEFFADTDADLESSDDSSETNATPAR